MAGCFHRQSRRKTEAIPPEKLVVWKEERLERSRSISFRRASGHPRKRYRPAPSAESDVCALPDVNAYERFERSNVERLSPMCEKCKPTSRLLRYQDSDEHFALTQA